MLAGETLELRAPTGAVFARVLFSSYGDPIGVNGNYYIGTVDSPLSISAVEKEFIGKIILQLLLLTQFLEQQV